MLHGNCILNLPPVSDNNRIKILALVCSCFFLVPAMASISYFNLKKGRELARRYEQTMNNRYENNDKKLDSKMVADFKKKHDLQ